MSKITVIDHPLVKHKLTHLRDKTTEHFVFRKIVNELSYLMVYEATRGLKTRSVEVETPLEKTNSDVLDDDVVIVPILRAGLGMLEGCQSMIPNARVGFVGIYRNEETLEPVEYYLKIPNVENAKLLLVDPMLATGGSLSATVTRLKGLGARHINIICILASPEGIRKVEGEHPDVDIFCACIDDGLDRNGYILPGIGDCGDRIFGTL
ncbi:MAG: uracil phosphoribosyltransferase [Candidatus Thermoplasmatota archaeon]|nr:uracil phosphoribosyltransferase [Euryarchaeota archaeon]MBU4071050.1 uracil phosphoribosyltransferase [Candidatus Thermoplasmatota archaeon]MBU4144113.1 uracil phosphoribosyltransferase [Candidatus Thermoplasmatota archaeon]MBU4591992.1 uracil phosphoribosyltransferase [Candidatus Thermoplasmatota archaeon]